MKPRTSKVVRLGTYGIVAAALVTVLALALLRLGNPQSRDHAASAAQDSGLRLQGPPGLEETLEKDAAIDNTTPPGRLVEAARAGDAERVRVLLAAGVPANALESRNGHGPLHQAAGANSLEVVEVLLTAGADPTAPDRKGLTPLMRAAYSAALDAGRCLLARGAQVNARHDPDGSPALMHLVAGLFVRRMGGDGSPSTPDQIEFAQLLLEHGADPNLPSKSGDQVLKAVVVLQDEALLKLLLQHGARIAEVSDIHALALIPGPVGDMVKTALQEAGTE